MSPTLSPRYHEAGERDLVFSLKPYLIGKVSRGDVVIFTKPHEPEEESVKRIIGLPGDTILRDVRRVGKQREEGGKISRQMGLEAPRPIVKVPLGHVWVEGDNWRDSLDSNDFGPVMELHSGNQRLS